MKTINFYFDFLSPFSYFAWKRHKKLLSDEVKFKYIPVAMGQLFNHFEIKGPALVKPKREYLLRFCYRYAEKNSIPFEPPIQHPFNPLYALRLATQECSGKHQENVIEALFNGAWGLDKIELSNPEAIEKSLNDLNLPGVELMESVSSSEVRKALKNNVKLAISNDVFGVPTFTLENELFWGNDSIDDLKLFLSNSDNWNKESYNRALSANPL